MYQYYSSATKEVQIVYFNLNTDFFVNLSISIFSYVNHFAIHTIFLSMKNTKPLGFYTTVSRSSYFPMLLYCLLTFTGSISLGNNIPDFIILRSAIEGSSDILMLIAQIGFFVIISFSIIVRIKVMTQIIFSILVKRGVIRKRPAKKISRITKVVITTLISFIPMGLSFFVGDNVLNIISIFSSICCPYYIIICPSKYYFALKRFEAQIIIFYW